MTALESAACEGGEGDEDKEEDWLGGSLNSIVRQENKGEVGRKERRRDNTNALIILELVRTILLTGYC